MRVFKTIIALYIVFQIAGCAIVKEFEKNTSNIKSFNEKTAVVSFSRERGLKAGREGDESDFIQAFHMLTLGIWPFPQDHRTITAPDLWDNFNKKIADELDADLAEYLSSCLANGVTIDWQKEIGSDKLTINKIIDICKLHKVKHLYLVRYNEYTEVELIKDFEFNELYRSDVISWTTTYEKLSGSILMASRMIIDVDENKILLDRRRMGENYWWNFLFLNGWGQSRDVTTSNYIDDNVSNYILSVGMGNYESAKIKLAMYLAEKDYHKLF